MEKLPIKQCEIESGKSQLHIKNRHDLCKKPPKSIPGGK